MKLKNLLQEQYWVPGKNGDDELARFEEYLKDASIKDLRTLATVVQHADKYARKWGFTPKKTLGPRRTKIKTPRQLQQEPQRKSSRFDRWLGKSKK